MAVKINLPILRMRLGGRHIMEGRVRFYSNSHALAFFSPSRAPVPLDASFPVSPDLFLHQWTGISPSTSPLAQVLKDPMEQEAMGDSMASAAPQDLSAA